MSFKCFCEDKRESHEISNEISNEISDVDFKGILTTINETK